MIELSLLKALSVRSNLEMYLKLLNPKTLSIQTIELLKDYRLYFEQYQTDVVDFGEFQTFFFVVLHPNLDEKSLSGYKEIIKRVGNLPLEEVSVTNVIAAFQQQEAYAELHNDLDKNVDITTILTKVTKLSDSMASLSPIQPIGEDMDINLALRYVDRSNGLQWRLDCLRDHLEGGLIKGDFILLSGYVDSGKTSFAASEVSYMAEQLKGDQWIAWLNTEGNWEQILSRIYQATLNCTQKELTDDTEAAILSYTEKMHGNKNRIKVLNYQRKSIKDVEKLCKSNPPSLIVFDLLDAIQGFDKYLGSEGNAVEKYGQLYQWARVIATEVCPVIAISQLNRNGNDTCYPKMTELSGSGEKKQGAATCMIMIGSEEGNSTERYLSTPKNKISGNKGWRYKVTFDNQRSRFKD